MGKILTIIVPAYNMEKYIEKDLDSLVITNKGFNDIEVIVVNDGSKDNTLSIAKMFSVKYPNIFKVIDKENGNYGSCINAGLSVAQGEFVKILDADDYFLNENFAKYIQALKESSDNNEKIDLIFNDYHSVNEDGKTLKQYTKNLEPYKVYDINKCEDLILFEGIQHHCIAYRTSNLRDFNYVQSEGVPYTDQEWITIPLFMVNKLKYIPVDLYAYLVGRPGQSIDQNVMKASLEKQRIVLFNILKKFSETEYYFPKIKCDIVKSVVFILINIIYSKYLIEFENEIQMKALDYTFKAMYPLLYAESNNILLGGKLRRRYIKHWRDNPDGIKFRIDKMLFKLKKVILR